MNMHRPFPQSNFPAAHAAIVDNYKQVGVQHRPSAVNVTLPAFAAEYRAAAPLLLNTWRCRSIFPARTLHGAQQQTRRTPLLRSSDGTETDRRTDPVPFRRPCSAYNADMVPVIVCSPFFQRQIWRECAAKNCCYSVSQLQPIGL